MDSRLRVQMKRDLIRKIRAQNKSLKPKSKDKSKSKKESKKKHT